MANNSKKIIIAGAGAIGNYLGVELHRHGQRVEFLGTARIVDAVSQQGLTLEYPDNHCEQFRPGELVFTTDPACCRNARLVIITVKSHTSEALARQLAPHLSADTVVLTLQNGISNKARLQKLLPDITVLGGMVTYNAVEKSPTCFRLTTHGEIYIEKHSPSLSPLFQGIGCPAREIFPLEPVLWSKLLLNLVNPLNALSGQSLKHNLSDRAFRRQWADCMREGLRILKKAGIRPARVTPLPPSLLPFVVSLPNGIYLRLAKNMSDMDESATSSMAQDLAKGRRTEIDFLTGELLRLGKELGVPTPANQKVYDRIQLRTHPATPR